MQSKFVTRVSSFFSPSTVTGGQASKSYILFISAPFPLQHTPPGAEKKSGVPYFLMSFERHRQTPELKHDEKTRHVE